MAAKRYLLLAALLLAAPAALHARRPAAAFGSLNVSRDTGSAPAAPSVSAPAAVQPQLQLPLAPKKYTVILLINGKNNLAPFMVRKMMELEELGSDANINFVVELGLMKPEPACSTCAVPNMHGADWEGTRRYYVLPNPAQPAATIVSSLRLPAPEDIDMGDSNSLVDFVNWSKANFPAQKYILVIGNHGGAWVDRAKKPAASANKGVSYDDVTGNYITTPQIGEALRASGGADVLIFDDCLMQAAEVAGEVGDAAGFMVGSEEIGYSNHFKPAQLFAPLKADPNMSTADFVAGYMATFAAYNKALWDSTGKYPATMSSVVPARVIGLEALVKRYVEAALAVPGPDARLAYREAMRDVIRYHYVYCADLYNFVELAQQNLAAKITAGSVTESPQTRALDTAADDLKGYITGALVLNNFTSGNLNGVEYSKSRGVSIYIPSVKTPADIAGSPVFLIAPGTLQTKYTDLQFDKATGWSNFVKYLISR